MQNPILKICFLVIIISVCQYFSEAKAQDKTVERCKYTFVDLPSGGVKITITCDGNVYEEIICPCGVKPDGKCEDCNDLVVISEHADAIANKKDFWKLIKIIEQMNLTSVSYNKQLLEKQDEILQLMKADTEVRENLNIANQIMFKFLFTLSRGKISKEK